MKKVLKICVYAFFVVPLQPVFHNIENLIRVIRGKQVMLDHDLAQLYGVETRVQRDAPIYRL
ncbi:MAG: ORF6N domain-containing protein [Paludibacteraceae bacterium]|nr:ORF6N domain-containing protein [Paludibacteraceae bacterium]